MIKNSLSSKITIVFIFSILLLCMLFIVLFKYQTERNLELMKERQVQSINYIFMLYRNNLSPKGINEYFSNFGLKLISNKDLKNSVISKGVIVFQKNSDIGRFSSIRYNNRYYLFIDNMVSSMLFESEYKKRPSTHLWIGFVMALIILISMYVSILKSIAPLKGLRQEIRKFSLGDMEIDCKSDKEDEIAEVANEFDRAASRLRDMIQSRRLFLRSIMHELKTPIGKGRIVSEMLSDERSKNRLVNIFERLNLLINQFSKIEQIVSKQYTLDKKEYNIVYIIEHAIDMLMLETDKQALHVKTNFEENFMLEVDFDSFALAIKNLLDNAIKYAEDRVVHVHTKNNTLYIKNRASAMDKPINEYYKPFVSGSGRAKDGLGLGLYIARNILKLNEYDLQYNYEDREHSFMIRKNKDE